MRCSSRDKKNCASQKAACTKDEFPSKQASKVLVKCLACHGTCSRMIKTIGEFNAVQLLSAASAGVVLLVLEGAGQGSGSVADAALHHAQ
eukprot:1157731-Pelagomonas_calceolata.AAC.21